MKQKLAETLLWMLLIGVLASPFLWAIATVHACGWKGLFVECRITENR